MSKLDVSRQAEFLDDQMNSLSLQNPCVYKMWVLIDPLLSKQHPMGKVLPVTTCCKKADVDILLSLFFFVKLDLPSLAFPQVSLGVSRIVWLVLP